MQRAKASRSIVGPLNRNGSLSLADARKQAARSRFTSASGAPGLSYAPRPLPLAQPTSSPMIPTTRIPVVGHLMALLLPAAIGGFYCTPTDFALPTARARLCRGPVYFAGYRTGIRACRQECTATSAGAASRGGGRRLLDRDGVLGARRTQLGMELRHALRGPP